jgi:UPF0716 family protein affecting phage T7 exclusion
VSRDLLRSGAGALLLVSIMFIGSLGLWVGTPLGWLWIGGQIQASTDSLGVALSVMFAGAVATIVLLAVLLGRLSDAYRWNHRVRGKTDPGHVVLEGVLVTSAGVTLVVFVAWFFLFAGASPIPVGLTL